jgi:hypothetical protein
VSVRSRRDIVDQHLRTFSVRAHLGERLALGADGVCGLGLGGDDDAVDVGIEVRDDDGLVLFHAEIGDLDARLGPDIHRRLLALAAYGVETRGGVLGLDAGTGKIVITFAWQFESFEYAQFEAMLERLFVSTNYIRDLLAAEAVTGPGGSGPSQTSPTLLDSSPGGPLWG